MFGSDLAVKLPYQFDPERLLEDLRIAEGFEFKSHPLRYHDGSWNVINLIYAGGDLDYRHEGDFGFGTQPPAPTEALERCPCFAEVLSSLPGQIKMARLSALPAGGRIHRHYDPIESVDFDNVRLHIPVRTDPQVIFHLGFRRRIWRAGEVWYGDFTFPHSIHNRSSITRVHIIVDLVPDEAGLSWFPPGYLDEASKLKRARLRQRHKDMSWYLTRIDQVLGRGPKPAEETDKAA